MTEKNGPVNLDTYYHTRESSFFIMQESLSQLNPQQGKWTEAFWQITPRERFHPWLTPQ